MAPDPVRPLGFFKDYITTIKISNQTPWALKFHKKYLAHDEIVKKEPEDVPAKTVGSGGIYQDNNSPEAVSTVVVYDSPDSNWRFAWDCVNPLIGLNTVYASIVSGDAAVDKSLFDSLEDSKPATASKVLTVEGTQYKFTISATASQGDPCPTFDLVIEHTTDLSEPETESQDKAVETPANKDSAE